MVWIGDREHEMGMKVSGALLSAMQCIECEGGLFLSEKGDLVCKKCGRVYPFVKPGYFNFMPVEIPDTFAQHNSTDIWDAHWRKIGHLDRYITSQEVDYLNETLPGVFKKNIVVDVGCGSGRNLEKYAQGNPRVLVLTDISDSIVIAIDKWHKIKEQYNEVETVFIRCDLHKMPFNSSSGMPVVYTSCGVFNIFKDQDVCIKEAMRFSNYIFILFNSPKNIFGKIYYSLNPVRMVMKKIIPFGSFRYFFGKISSYVGYPFIKFFIGMINRKVSMSFSREMLEFLIHDWIFTSPTGIAYDEEYYRAIGREFFESCVLEKTISRIVFYKRRAR